MYYLGSFKLWFLALLDWKWPLNDILANIVVLGQVEKLANLGGTFRSQATGDGGISKSGNFIVTLYLERVKEW